MEGVTQRCVRLFGLADLLACSACVFVFLVVLLRIFRLAPVPRTFVVLGLGYDDLVRSVVFNFNGHSWRIWRGFVELFNAIWLLGTVSLWKT